MLHNINNAEQSYKKDMEEKGEVLWTTELQIADYRDELVAVSAICNSANHF